MGYNEEFAESVIFDLESCAAPSVEDLLDPVRAPSNWKDREKIAAYQTEKLAERIATASLEPDLCEIVALGYQRGSGSPEVLTRDNADEAFMLTWFWEMTHRARFVGFNILQFDLPVLIRRSQLLGVEYPAINMDRYRTPHVDLLDRLSFQGKIPFRSLGFYCRRFNVPSADTVAGTDIPGLVARGDWDLVKSHCEEDITKTALLAARLGWFQMAGSEVA